MKYILGTFCLLIHFSLKSQFIWHQGGVIAPSTSVITYDTIGIAMRDANVATGMGNINQWNVIGSLSKADLSWMDGASSSIDVAVDAITSSSSQGSCSGGTTGFPDNTGNRVIYRTGASCLVTFSSLNNSKKYDVVFYAARASNSTTVTMYIGAESSAIASINNNCSLTAKISNITPSSGNITALITGSGSTSNAYMNGFYLIEHD